MQCLPVSKITSSLVRRLPQSISRYSAVSSIAPDVDWAADGLPFPSWSSCKAADSCYAHVWAVPLELHLHLISCARIATVNAEASWTGSQMKDAVRQLLQKGTAVAKITFGTAVWEDTLTAKELSLTTGSELHLIVAACDILVEAAGVWAVNGFYTQRGQEMMNGAPCYINDAGTLLFRYLFPNGKHYWYFSTPGNLSKSFGDYYRVKSEDLHPPSEGWTPDKCPLGAPEIPRVFNMLA